MDANKFDYLQVICQARIINVWVQGAPLFRKYMCQALLLYRSQQTLQASSTFANLQLVMSSTLHTACKYTVDLTAVGAACLFLVIVDHWVHVAQHQAHLGGMNNPALRTDFGEIRPRLLSGHMRVAQGLKTCWT